MFFGHIVALLPQRSATEKQLHCQLPPAAGGCCLHDRADSHGIAAGAQQMQRQGPVVAAPQGGQEDVLMDLVQRDLGTLLIRSLGSCSLGSCSVLNRFDVCPFFGGSRSRIISWTFMDNEMMGCLQT